MDNMTQISVDKALLDDLIDSKLDQITERINLILSKWGYDSITDFLTLVANGTRADAKDDATSLTNLENERKELSRLKKVNLKVVKRKKLSEYYDGLLEDEF